MMAVQMGNILISSRMEPFLPWPESGIPATTNDAWFIMSFAANMASLHSRCCRRQRWQVFSNRQRESRFELADYWQIARFLIAAENVLVRANPREDEYLRDLAIPGRLQCSIVRFLHRLVLVTVQIHAVVPHHLSDRR